MRIANGLPILAGLASAALAWAAAASPSGYHVEYAFQGGADGESPHSALLSHGGKLYGTLPVGGANGFGAIYAFDPATAAKTTVYSFKGGVDGQGPYSSLIDVGGLLYGTTVQGGASGQGTVYVFDPATDVETVVYAFKGGDDGYFPGDLTEVGGLLYGTTEFGGGTSNFKCVTTSCGTVFSLDPTTGVETILYAFTGDADGGNPGSKLVELGGKLYATGGFGGESVACFDLASCGMVFSFDPATGAEAVVHAFTGGSDGEGPDGLIKIGGTLFGTTEGGGLVCAESQYGCGTVFTLDPVKGAKTILYDFKGGADGADPGGLTKIGATLYGITDNGGHGRGTVYSLNPANGAETILHAFHGPGDGRVPEEGLIERNGRLWGTTDEGGNTAACPKYGCGVVFSLRP